ncbi:MAG: GIY-YIG nuclease family protein [Candidatus Moranbacteria bacterium]|nr:GIY-YIG nuclease family protein [Candidatus Moranbacteria bacterium]
MGFTYIFYYVYVLLSKKDGEFYIGFTENLKQRFEQHNNGESPATKCRRSFEIIFGLIFSTYGFQISHFNFRCRADFCRLFFVFQRYSGKKIETAFLHLADLGAYAGNCRGGIDLWRWKVWKSGFG